MGASVQHGVLLEELPRKCHEVGICAGGLEVFPGGQEKLISCGLTDRCSNLPESAAPDVSFIVELGLAGMNLGKGAVIVEIPGQDRDPRVAFCNGFKNLLTVLTPAAEAARKIVRKTRLETLD